MTFNPIVWNRKSRDGNRFPKAAQQQGRASEPGSRAEALLLLHSPASRESNRLSHPGQRGPSRVAAPSLPCVSCKLAPLELLNPLLTWKRGLVLGLRGSWLLGLMYWDDQPWGVV